MYVIAGLGNPTKKYEKTRHNTGFMGVDRLAREYDITIEESSFKGLMGKGIIEGEKVILIKPQTYMNLSGECIREVLDYYKLDPSSDLLVIYDDISLPVGKLRIRPQGSSGGHNGIKNIIANIGTEDFARIRIGIGEPVPGTMIDYVLERFPKEDEKLIGEALDKLGDIAKLLVKRDIDIAMNNYN